MKKIPLTKGAFAIVDDEDYKYLSQFNWYLHTEGYAIREICLGNKKKIRIRMHRELMNAPDRLDIDHINGNRIDNRKINLRICTRAENLRNSSIRSDNTSGYKGVRFHKASHLWHAYINFGGKQISLKYHKTKEQAAKAYNKAAIKYFGKFANLNNV